MNLEISWNLQAWQGQEIPLSLIPFGRSVNDLVHWLEDHALPLWAAAGYDRENGGFFERIGQDGKPCRADNRRARVQPRQVYCFATAGYNGWEGPWQELVFNGQRDYAPVFRRKDGFYGALASPEGRLIDDSFDLYNQAFSLLGLQQLALGMPEKRAEAEAEARSLLIMLRLQYGHPDAGFEEHDPPRTPLCANPHMHLLEAAMAWEETAEENKVWRELADDIARLALARFIDPRSGALREFFAHDWSPMPGEPGRVVEPGHLFEWSWLLTRWGLSRKNSQALQSARRLYGAGRKHGVCPTRRVVMMTLNDDLIPQDRVARLWGQTEWMKASALLAWQSTGHERETYLADAVSACRALDKFLRPCRTGLWFDKLNPDGTFIDEPAPASSFYHIVCAAYELADIHSQLKQELLAA